MTTKTHLEVDFAMSHVQPLSGFWTSNEVSFQISQAMLCQDPNWSIVAPGEPWEILRQVIIHLNTKGEYQIPPPLTPPHGYCIEQLPFPRDDGSSTYTRLRFYLGVFVDLVVSLGRRITECFGRDSWTVVSDLLIEDAENRRLVLLLRDITLAPRPAAINWLEQISRKGIRTEWQAGFYSGFWCRDCGVEALVTISTKMVAFLEQSKHISINNSAMISPQERSRVTVDSAGPNLVRLIYLGKEVRLTGMVRGLFVLLFWGQDNIVAFETIWRAIYETKTRRIYRPEQRGAPPAKMRRLKCSLEKRIRVGFGRPPGGHYWIEAEKGHGYLLNRISVNWQKLKGCSDRPPFLTVDPSGLDRRSQTNE
jgi:hypothetical protein